MKKKKIQIFCVLNKSLKLALCSVRKNMGHDDSTPYQAEVFILDQNNRNVDGTVIPRHVANVWNDGWGGESELKAVDRTSSTKEYLKKANEHCKEHKMFWEGKPFASYKLTDLCDVMAECFLTVKPDEYRNRTLQYRFDDDPVTIFHDGCNLYLTDEK